MDSWCLWGHLGVLGWGVACGFARNDAEDDHP